MAEALKRDPAELAAQLEAEPENTEAIFASLFEGRPAWSELLIYIDQFEELLTLADKGKIDAFVRMLKAINDSTRLRVVLTLRADFYARCVEILALSELLKHGTFPLSAPGSAALYEMVSKPADRAGLSFENGLVDQILRDTGADAGSLALLAYLLDELYHKSITGNQSLLTIAQYTTLGGVQGAIGKRAEEVVNGLPQDEQAALPRLFAEIVEVDARGRGTRRRAVMDRLNDDPAIRHIVAVLISARLLVTYEDDEKRSIIEVAHEALVREWDRLATWIVGAQSDLLLRRQLEQAARDWSNATSDKESYGLLGDRLLEAKRWQTHAVLDPQVAEYIQASEGYDVERRAEEDQRKQALLDAETSSHQAAQKAALQEHRATQRTRIAAAIGLISAVIIVGAIVALLSAQSEVVTANNQLAVAGTTVAGANATLTPIPMILTKAQQTVNDNEQISQSEKLAAEANSVLGDQTQDNLPAVLLSIRALKTAYSAQADAALVSALSSTFERREFIGHVGAINTSAYSPDGHFLLTGGRDGTARLWDVATGTQLRVFSDKPTNVDFGATATYEAQNAMISSGVICVAFSPDGRQVAIVDLAGVVRVWDVATARVMRTFKSPIETSSIATVAFSADGRYLLGGAFDNLAYLWDVANGTLVRTFNTDSIDNGLIVAVAFSHDDQRIMISSTDQSTRLWVIGTGINTWTYTNQVLSNKAKLDVTNAALSPNDQFIALGNNNGDVKLINIQSSQTVASFSGHNGSISSLAFSPDSRYLLTASADKTALLWNIDTGKQLQSFVGATDELTSVRLSPDNMTVFTTSKDGRGRLYSSGFGTQIDTYTGHTNLVTSVSFSPDRRYVITAGVDAVLLHDIYSGNVLRTITDPPVAVSAAAFSPDGRYIAIGGRADNGPPVGIWNTATGKNLRLLKYDTSISSVAFSPDGRYLVTGDSDATARLWDVATGENIRTYTLPTEPIAYGPNSLGSGNINAVAFSPDGRYLVTGSSVYLSAPTASQQLVRGGIELWDVASEQMLRTFTPKDDNGVAEINGDGQPIFGEIKSVTFSPDGRYILSGGNGTVNASTEHTATAFLWETATGNEVREFVGHTDAVNSVTFSPDGRYALTGSNDHTARLWNLAAGNTIRTFSGHRDAVTSVAFSGDGSLFLTGSADHTARLWDTDYRHFIEFACTQVWRDFTPPERLAFGLDSSPTCPQFADVNHPYTLVIPTEAVLGLLTTTPIESPTLSVSATFSSDNSEIFPTATYPGALLTFTPSVTHTAGPSPTATNSTTVTPVPPTNTSVPTNAGPTATIVIIGKAATPLARFTASATALPSATSSPTETAAPTDTPSLTFTPSPTPSLVSVTPTIQILGTLPNWTPLPYTTLFRPTALSTLPTKTSAPSITPTPPTATIVISPVASLPNWTPIASATAAPPTATAVSTTP